jgi:hypothetical protein
VTEWARPGEGDHPLGFVIGALDLTASSARRLRGTDRSGPAARRQWAGLPLMVEALRRMQAAGAPCVDLTVHLNNRAPPLRGVGFVTIGRGRATL